MIYKGLPRYIINAYNISSIGYLCHILYKWYTQLYFLIHNNAYVNMTNGICLNIHHNKLMKITPSSSLLVLTVLTLENINTRQRRK
jgi:hypothetical protein